MMALGTLTLPQRANGNAGVHLSVKSLKVVVVLDAAALAQALAPFATVETRIPFTLSVEDRQVKCEFAPRQVRKALNVINEHGADQVAVIIQGKLLAGDVIGEAGLVAQVKAPKATT